MEERQLEGEKNSPPVRMRCASIITGTPSSQKCPRIRKGIFVLTALFRLFFDVGYLRARTFSLLPKSPP